MQTYAYVHVFIPIPGQINKQCEAVELYWHQTPHVSFAQRARLFLGQKGLGWQRAHRSMTQIRVAPSLKSPQWQSTAGVVQRVYGQAANWINLVPPLTERWHSVRGGSQEIRQGFKGKNLHSPVLLVSIDLQVRHGISYNVRPVNQQKGRGSRWAAPRENIRVIWNKSPRVFVSHQLKRDEQYSRICKTPVEQRCSFPSHWKMMEKTWNIRMPANPGEKASKRLLVV